jgi:hypothetical protein
MSAGSLKSALDSVENPIIMLVHDHDTTSQIQHTYSHSLLHIRSANARTPLPGSYPSFCYFPPYGGGETMRC